MKLTDKIHCDDIVFCSKKRMQREIDKRYNAPIEVKDLLLRFPLNYKKEPFDERDYKFTASEFNIDIKAKVIPVVDYSDKMSSVKDQGQLGSCVAFAISAMKEWQEQTEHEVEVSEGKRDTRKEEEYNLSESWIYWKAKEIDAWPGEEGTSIRYGMKILKDVGVPTEKGWVYDDINYGKPKRWAKMVAKWSLIDSYWRINDLTELKQALLNGPVPIAVPVFYEFFYPDGGIIKQPENPDNMYGGHAICAVGYSDVDRLVKFKNSWGTDWGQKGYGYLTYAYIQNYLWDAWTCKDLRVTREMLKG